MYVHRLLSLRRAALLPAYEVILRMPVNLSSGEVGLQAENAQAWPQGLERWRGIRCPCHIRPAMWVLSYFEPELQKSKGLDSGSSSSLFGRGGGLGQHSQLGFGAWMAASQMLSTWLGPPVSFKMRFQS